MARNYSNIKYETFYQASEAAKRRCEKEGVSDDYYAVYRDLYQAARPQLHALARLGANRASTNLA